MGAQTNVNQSRCEKYEFDKQKHTSIKFINTNLIIKFWKQNVVEFSKLRAVQKLESLIEKCANGVELEKCRRTSFFAKNLPRYSRERASRSFFKIKKIGGS